MISYNNGEVVQSLRQYEMFANSLKLISSNEERKMVINQLNKLLAKIIKESNAVYEEEYNKLYEREIEFIDEERTRLTLLVELINQRISYVDKLCQKHYQLTYENIDLPPIRGKDELEELQNRIKIIDKYSKNIKTCHELELEIENMESKLSLAKEKINVNDSLNQELEHKLIELLHNTFSELSLDLLIDEQSNIEDNFYECENLYSIAKKNLEKSRIKNPEMINECQEMLNEIEEDYKEYNNKMCILGLIEIYDRKVDTYDELLTKRNKIKELMNGVTNKEFLNRVETEINKQYSSIIKEEQDINTYNELLKRVEEIKKEINDIKEEINSEEFQQVLKPLLDNERKRQEKILKEQRLKEEEERQKRLEIERKRQEEISKKQRLIEETRKKEMEKRTKKLLEEQQKSILNKKNSYNFETMKDISLNKEKENIEPIKPNNEETFSNNKYINEVVDNSSFKNKYDIEKELFDEFNDQQFINKEENNIEELPKKDKLPLGNFDDYAKKFDEGNIDKSEFDELFSDNFFPTIPNE